MASGDTLIVLVPADNDTPEVAFARWDTRGGTSAHHPILKFDDTTDQDAVFTSVLPRNYGGNGVTLTITWVAASATSGSVIWRGSFGRLAGSANIDNDGFATAVNVTGTPTAVNGEYASTQIAFTDGAQMNSLVAGDPYRLKLSRGADGSHGTDSMVGDAELVTLELRET